MLPAEIIDRIVENNRRQQIGLPPLTVEDFELFSPSPSASPPPHPPIDEHQPHPTPIETARPTAPTFHVESAEQRITRARAEDEVQRLQQAVARAQEEVNRSHQQEARVQAEADQQAGVRDEFNLRLQELARARAEAEAHAPSGEEMQQVRQEAARARAEREQHRHDVAHAQAALNQQRQDMERTHARLVEAQRMSDILAEAQRQHEALMQRAGEIAAHRDLVRAHEAAVSAARASHGIAVTLGRARAESDAYMRSIGERWDDGVSADGEGVDGGLLLQQWADRNRGLVTPNTNGVSESPPDMTDGESPEGMTDVGPESPPGPNGGQSPMAEEEGWESPPPQPDRPFRRLAPMPSAGIPRPYPGFQVPPPPPPTAPMTHGGFQAPPAPMTNGDFQVPPPPPPTAPMTNGEFQVPPPPPPPMTNGDFQEPPPPPPPRTDGPAPRLSPRHGVRYTIQDQFRQPADREASSGSRRTNGNHPRAASPAGRSRASTPTPTVAGADLWAGVWKEQKRIEEEGQKVWIGWWAWECLKGESWWGVRGGGDQGSGNQGSGSGGGGVVGGDGGNGDGEDEEKKEEEQEDPEDPAANEIQWYAIIVLLMAMVLIWACYTVPNGGEI